MISLSKYWSPLTAAILLLLFAFSANAQSDSLLPPSPDTTIVLSTEKPIAIKSSGHSPSKATWMSVALPGLGQIYNDKWWKTIVVYAGFATTGYFIVENNRELKYWTNIIDVRLDGDPNTIDEYDGIYSTNQLFSAQNYYRRYRDLSIIIAVGIYGLQILDANVDAHLYDFDVSDDLSFHWEPTLLGSPSMGWSPGVKLKIEF